MRFRKLRIAWSVAWGIACPLLLALWVWSYHHLDSVVLKHWPGKVTTLESVFGKVYVGFYEGTTFLHISSAPITRNQFFDSGTSAIIVPHSYLALGCLVVAVIPWVPLIKRFSLRTLLIAITLIAVGLGTVAWLSR
jgi:hypothetical protein